MPVPSLNWAIIRHRSEKGKASWIIIVAEGKAHAQDISKIITDTTGLETRVAVLGHIQRGGRPTAKDRILGARLGNFAVEKLREGLTDYCVTEKNGDLVTIPLNIAITKKDIEFSKYYRLIKILT